MIQQLGTFLLAYPCASGRTWAFAPEYFQLYIPTYSLALRHHGFDREMLSYNDDDDRIELSQRKASKICFTNWYFVLHINQIFRVFVYYLGERGGHRSLPRKISYCTRVLSRSVQIRLLVLIRPVFNSEFKPQLSTTRCVILPIFKIKMNRRVACPNLLIVCWIL